MSLARDSIETNGNYLGVDREVEFRVGTACWTDPTLVNSDLCKRLPYAAPRIGAGRFTKRPLITYDICFSGRQVQVKLSAPRTLQKWSVLP
jgi:hypothetical protein